MIRNVFLSAAAIWFLQCCASCFSQVPSAKDIPVPDPELERATFRVPEGFEVNLFAADPLLAKPIQMNFDEDGRLWVASSEVYPQIVPGAAASDRVVVLEDLDHDGVADRTNIFAEGLLIPTGIAPGDGGAWVANSTELLHFRDTDGDLKADSKTVVLSGFGTEDTHHILHTLRWGYDGSLYFNQSIYIHSHVETPWGVRRLNAGGIWQFRPETLELGVFMRGLVNSWGHHFDRYGQSFATDGAGGEGINYVIPGAYYFTAADAERLVRGMNPGSPKHCGLELIDTPMLPPDWQGNAITNDFRGHRVVRFVLTEEASGFVSREQQEVIWSDHVSFRPIDVKVGPDGALYIADWYNPIIQHGEVDFRDERRDHTHGRIWRVTWKDAPKREFRPVSTRTNQELFETLRSDDGVERQSAKQILRQRGPSVPDELQTWLDTVSLTDEERDRVLLESLWCFQAHSHLHPDLLRTLLSSEDGRIRAAAVRVLSHWKYQIPDSLALLTQAVEDSHPRVRLEAVRALSFSALDDSQRQIADGSAFGNSDPASVATLAAYDDPKLVETALIPLRFAVDSYLDYAMWMTTRELSSRWRPAFERGEMNFSNDADQIAFAFSALGSGAPVELLMKDLYDTQVSPEKRVRLAGLIAGSADAGQLERLVAMALRANDSTVFRIALNTTRSRKIAVRVEPDDIQVLTNSEDPALRRSALRAIGQWRIDRLYTRLEEIVAADEADPADLEAVFDGIAAGADGRLLQLLTVSGGDAHRSSSVRAAAIERLVLVNPDAAAPMAVELFEALPADATVAPGLTRSMIAARNGAGLLASALNGKQLRSETARDILRVLRESGRSEPELESALRTAGNITSRKSISAEEFSTLLKLTATADPVMGERVYRNEQLGCLKCHAIGGSGGLVGPDMISLGATAQPDYLLESLLNPNAKIKENYHTTVVATVDGEVYAGVLIQKSDRALTLRTAENKVVEIPADRIEEQSQGVSLMPEGLVDNLTNEEIASLVRFLSELGRTPEFTLSRRRLLRSWQVVLPTREAYHQLNRTSFSQVAASPSLFSWASRYSTVAGHLPADVLPTMTVRDVPVAFARSQINVTSRGMIGFGLNSGTGLEVRVDGIPVVADGEFQLELSPGLHAITLTVDTSKRTEPIELELIAVDGGGNAEPVNF